MYRQLLSLVTLTGLIVSGCGEQRSPEDLIKELEKKCAASSQDLPPSMGSKEDFYEACVFGGKNQLRANNMIP
jgi:hypothetical protein